MPSIEGGANERNVPCQAINRGAYKNKTVKRHNYKLRNKRGYRLSSQEQIEVKESYASESDIEGSSSQKIMTRSESILDNGLQTSILQQNKHLLRFWESKKDLLADFIEQENQERLEQNA